MLQIGAGYLLRQPAHGPGSRTAPPTPTIFPGGAEGISFATGFWADRLLFLAAVPVLFAKLGPAVPEAFIEDRKKLMGGGDFRAVMGAGPLFQDQLRAHAQLIDGQLADGRACCSVTPSHGPTPRPITRSGSCSTCRRPPARSTNSSASHRGLRGCAASDTDGGARVRVVPDDYGFDPVEGELVASSVHEVAIRCSASEVGDVVVHFPRAGFRVARV